jgi:phage baseplate assembly protein W
MATDFYGTDLRLTFARSGNQGSTDFSIVDQDLETVSGIDNLLQALTLRLLVDRGELGGLGHRRYGSRIRDMIGETLDQANLELLRRYVRKELMQDPRVEEVLSVTVTPRHDDRGAVDVSATVTAATGEAVLVEVTFDA